MPPPLPAARATLSLRLFVCAGWLLFTLMVVAISWGGSVLRGRPWEIGSNFIWNLGWLLWAGATFIVARLARRFPIERPHLLRSIALHAALGIGLGVLILLTEFFFAHGLQAIWPGAPRANAFLGFIVYKFHVYFLIYWMILGATRALDYYTQFRESALLASQLETQLAQAQLQSLQAQLQPHFLFNTHHAIVSLMLQQDNAAAIKMLTRLSDLLRLTLRHPERQTCSLREECEALDLYFGIQRERFREHLTIETDFPNETLAAEVPWLSLQPLVENALRHGLEARSAPGILQVQSRLVGGSLVLSVSDNGPGFPANFTLESARGIGLRNTAARLARLHGAAAQLELGRSALGGAEVRLTLPFRRIANDASTGARPADATAEFQTLPARSPRLAP